MSVAMGNLPTFSPLSPPGALIYLLDLFCNSTHPQVRSQTAELFSKMTSDKLVGPKVRHYPCVEDHRERPYPSVETTLVLCPKWHPIPNFVNREK
jgi:hypothetical protein